MDIMSRIRQSYQELSPTNKKIADYIQRFGEVILNLNTSEIADKIGTSPAAVTRFTKKIGYKGLEEVKLALATHYANEGHEKEVVDPIVGAEDDIETLVKKVNVLIEHTLIDLQYSISLESLKEAISIVKKANIIYLAGIGASSLTAYDIYHKFNRAGKQTQYSFDPHMNVEFLNFSTSNDVLIAISYSGLSKEVLAACEIARSNETPVIIITANNSIGEESDCLLQVPNNENIVRVGAISSVYSSMTVGNLLFLGSIQDSIENDLSQRMTEVRQVIQQLKQG